MKSLFFFYGNLHKLSGSGRAHWRVSNARLNEGNLCGMRNVRAWRSYHGGLEAKWCKFKVHIPWAMLDFLCIFSEHKEFPYNFKGQNSQANGFFMLWICKRGVDAWQAYCTQNACLYTGALYFFRTMFITRSEKLFFSGLLG